MSLRSVAASEVLLDVPLIGSKDYLGVPDVKQRYQRSCLTTKLTGEGFQVQIEFQRGQV